MIESHFLLSNFYGGGGVDVSYLAHPPLTVLSPTSLFFPDGIQSPPLWSSSASFPRHLHHHHSPAHIFFFWWNGGFKRAETGVQRGLTETGEEQITVGRTRRKDGG